jgi:hypothetical protein
MFDIIKTKQDSYTNYVDNFLHSEANIEKKNFDLKKNQGIIHKLYLYILNQIISLLTIGLQHFL